jgi:threonine/homoserine/homoserine lactone efflux protein
MHRTIRAVADVIGDILPFAIGIAISPVPLIAVILMLFSGRARINGPAFLVGSVLGVTAVTVLALWVADAGDVATDSDAATGVAWVKLLLGVFLIVLAFRTWRNRPPPGQDAAMPNWMAAIDGFSPLRAFGSGVLLSSVLNPKNLVLAIGAGAAIAQANLSGSEDTVVVVVFVALASVSIAGAVLVYLFGGDKAQHLLDGWKVWLGQNNATVMSVLLLVMGVLLAGKGFDAFD